MASVRRTCETCDGEYMQIGKNEVVMPCPHCLEKEEYDKDSIIRRLEAQRDRAVEVANKQHSGKLFLEDHEYIKEEEWERLHHYIMEGTYDG